MIKHLERIINSSLLLSPSFIFAQEYYDDYESEYSQYYEDYESEYNGYEKYMKDDNHKSISQKINCDNTNINIPSSISNNPDIEDEPESTSSSNGDSQSGQRIDRMNGDAFSHQKGDYGYVCQNNNNNNQIVLLI